MRISLALVAVGALIYLGAYLWAKPGYPVAANIGAGALGFGMALVILGAVSLAWVTVARVCGAAAEPLSGSAATARRWRAGG